MLDKWADKDQAEVDKLAFRKIIWQTIDSLRKVQKHDERNTDLEASYELYQPELDWDNLVVLKDEIKKLNPIEYALLFEHLLANKTVTQLAQECGIPRISLQRMKKKLLLKLRAQL
ncbi:sigma-70 family RNA polymerase sigma factor [Lactobacillus sp. PV034]|uniref:sigma-70 family RNA polymerase sigma factor n=1 Tax=Lactobacillus sp. PV034 TaxID=2594495 RepID=UPI0022402268|nr:sigma-70 family RNA polymerase sigma factor [Lactobacillus sp. PV034]